jgi:hypothetical protein
MLNQKAAFPLKIAALVGTNCQVKDKEVGVYFQRPFDILLKFKALQNYSNVYLEGKRKGRTSNKPERTVLSGWQDYFIILVRFIQKYSLDSLRSYQVFY